VSALFVCVIPLQVRQKFEHSHNYRYDRKQYLRPSQNVLIFKSPSNDGYIYGYKNPITYVFLVGWMGTREESCTLSRRSIFGIILERGEALTT
jgi:hypothetical protein